MQTYICSTCGKQFERNPSAANRRGATKFYCSRSCAARRQQRELPDLICPQCGKTFYRTPSERKLNNNYCSRTCANQAQSRTLQDIPSLRTSQGVEMHCLTCGIAFYVKPHRVTKAKYCSRACFHAARFGESRPAPTNNVAGSNNPNFRGTSNLVTARENGRKYLGNECMICGWDEVIDIHHIVPRRHRGTNAIDNLIVLCPNHHRLADLSRISTDELLSITRAAIALVSDRLPLFDPLQSDQPENDLPLPLFDSTELPTQSD